MKKFGVLMVIAAICLLAAACSTVPGHGKMEYEVLGYVDSVIYDSYDAALKAATDKFPAANGVVYQSTVGANKMLPFPVKVGNWAIKYTKGSN